MKPASTAPRSAPWNVASTTPPSSWSPSSPRLSVLNQAYCCNDMRDRGTGRQIPKLATFTPGHLASARRPVDLVRPDETQGASRRRAAALETEMKSQKNAAAETIARQRCGAARKRSSMPVDRAGSSLYDLFMYSLREIRVPA